LEKNHRYQVEGLLRELEKLFFCFIEEQAKAHSRELRKTDRELVRDRHKLEAEEQRIVKI
jgi:hypothetical protein